MSIKSFLLKYYIFQQLLSLKLYLKSIYQKTHFAKRHYDAGSLDDFELYKNNPKYIYEKEIKLLPKLALDDAIVFDIGANRGEYTYYLSKTFTNGQIYSFEPGSRARSILSQIVQKYELKNVKINGFALSNKAGTVNLMVPYHNRQAHIVETDNSAETETIITETLDAYCKKSNISKIDLIKCDTEGAEFLVFKGGQSMLSKLKPIIMVEIVNSHCLRFGNSAEDVYSFLNKLGYNCYIYNIKDDKLHQTQEIIMKHDGSVWSRIDSDLTNNNYIFIPESKIQAFSNIILK